MLALCDFKMVLLSHVFRGHEYIFPVKLPNRRTILDSIKNIIMEFCNGMQNEMLNGLVKSVTSRAKINAQL